MLSKMLMRKSSGPSTLSFLSSATSTSSTITIPATAAIGDLAVLYDLTYTFDTQVYPTIVTPTGWTQVNVAQDYDTTNMYYFSSNLSMKILTSGDSGSAITGMTAYSDIKLMQVFRLNTPIVSNTMEDLVNSYCWYPDDVRVVQTVPYVTLTAIASATWGNTWYDGTISGGGGQVHLGYKIFNSNPVEVTVAASTASDCDFLQSVSIEVT